MTFVQETCIANYKALKTELNSCDKYINISSVTLTTRANCMNPETSLHAEMRHLHTLR